jgi:hypothetical protein
MSETFAGSAPKLIAVSHSNTGCFPWTLGIGGVVIVIAFLNEVPLTAQLVLLGITALVARIVMPGWVQQRQFVQQSKLVQGTITRLWHKIVEDSEGGKSTYYYFTYTFPGGQETCQSITAEQCLFANVGDAVTVRYLPDQPHLSQVDWAATLSERLCAIENATLNPQ